MENQLIIQLPVDPSGKYKFSSDGMTSITSRASPYIPVFFKESNGTYRPVINGVDNIEEYEEYTTTPRIQNSQTGNYTYPTLQHTNITRKNYNRPIYGINTSNEYTLLPMNIYGEDIHVYTPVKSVNFNGKLLGLPLNKYGTIVYNENLAGILYDTNEHLKESFNFSKYHCMPVTDPSDPTKTYKFAGCGRDTSVVGGKQFKLKKSTKQKSKKIKIFKKSRKLMRRRGVRSYRNTRRNHSSL